jgi:stromal membrane-associated protein
MSRRPPNPSAEKTAKNSQAIKSLLKLEANKLCADCKRNKHPRWASWNLGVFICIRCSGIHRGMGTHISRVKSVDLDSWTDEQLASLVSWGNARAKKYWEAKLAPDHLPSEAKIENFIRTKYELKRWVMDGPMPDPSTLDEDEDDDVPLAVVKEKQIERRESLRGQQNPIAAPPASAAIDLIGGPDPIPRSSSGPPTQRVPPKAEPAPPKTTTTSKDSLLGLDFFQPAAPPRPASTTGSAGGLSGQSRPDLKQSILSLYASAPKPPPQPQVAQAPSGGMFGGMPSPTRTQGSVGGLNDAFGSLSFSSQPAKPADPFASFGSAAATMAPKPSTSNAFDALSGGSFFDTKPAAQTTAAPHQRQASTNSGFGDFGSFSSPSTSTHKPTQSSSSAFGDLFGLSSPPSQPTPTSTTTMSPPPPPPSNPAPPPASNSVFNLSSTVQSMSPTPAATSINNPVGASSSVWSNSSDVWGSNAWGAPETKSPNISKPAVTQSSDFGWGASPTAGTFASQSIVPGSSGGFAPAPKVAADEEFGGWTSSSAPAAGSAKPASGFGGNEDLFSNVWQ